MQAFAPRQAQLATLLMPPVRCLGAGRHGLAHAIRRAYDDRAQSRRELVVEALPEHRGAEETGCTEGLESRVDFFEVAATAFLAIVHAENPLRLGFAGQRRCAAMIGEQGCKDLLPIVVFVGQQPDQAALVASQGIGAAKQGIHPGSAKLAQLATSPPQSLCQDEQRPGGQCFRVGRRGVARFHQAVGEMRPVAMRSLSRQMRP
ncbi:MAG: hypothetical protein AW09_002430 [Candidatus Accumulibacter phosphatis]|uniref:Uncharacterized protein n=1 Tax=Candidatus Accumulibacter phosphatis TaxID=327160 RepID=A0A080LUS8_9PROT|nr:MAG: hypothetical protein AW09_002430 [Candidatus Accumulibacter phosphatis]